MFEVGVVFQCLPWLHQVLGAFCHLATDKIMVKHPLVRLVHMLNSESIFQLVSIVTVKLQRIYGDIESQSNRR